MENDKTYLLNIQQQVRKNQIEIELLKSGIKIVGAGETLPASANEGDCYLLGTDNDYALNAYVNGNWIPLGSFPAVGPQGVPGVKGDPAVISYITCAARAIDYGLAPHVSASVNGETVSFDFELPGGPRGLQGPKGEKGDKGDQGNVGPQGPQGEPGNSIRLFQNPSVVTASDLPAASVVGAGVGYLVGTYGTGYELYVTANDPLEWVDAGPFIPAQVIVDPKLDRLSENAVQNKPVAKAIGMPSTFSVTAAVAQGLILTDHFDDIYTNGYPFSAVDGGTRQKYLSFRESVGGGGTSRSYDYVSFSYNIYGLSVSSAMVAASSVGLIDSASVSAVDNFVIPKRSELVAAKNSLNAEIARSKAADDLHQKEITLLKNLVYDTVAASFSYSADYVHWMDIPASVEVSGSYHEVLDDAAAQIEVIEGTSVAWNQLVDLQQLTTQTINGVTFTVNAQTATITASGTASDDAFFSFMAIGDVANKYFYVGGCPANGSAETYSIAVRLLGNTAATACDTGGGYIYNPLNNPYRQFGILVKSGVTVSGLVFKPVFTDLTKAFPTDTPTTLNDPRIQAILAGTPSLNYDAGSIKSSTVDEVISHGFNLWDEDTEVGYIDISTGEANSISGYFHSKNPIKCLPNTTYYFKTATDKYPRVFFYGANGEYLSYAIVSGTGDSTFVTPLGARFIRFYVNEATYNHDICINKSNVSLNGNYKPWVAPMSVGLAALGVPLSKRKLMSARLARDRIYAVMQPDETYQLRRTGKCYYEQITSFTGKSTGQSSHRYYFGQAYTAMAPASNNTVANITCNRFVANTWNQSATGEVGISVSSDGYIYVSFGLDENFDTLEKANAWLANNPLYVVYELSTPTDELLSDGLTFGDLELLIEKGGYLSIDGDGDYYGAIPGLTVDLPILRYE